MTTIQVRAERMVAGGAALCRDDDGRVVLVAGALPGERVEVAVEDRHGSLHGEVVEVLDAAVGRVEPPCPFVAAGCGGCDWQHATPDLQSSMRTEIVVDALRRLGHLDAPVVRAGPPVPAERSRNSLRLAVQDGRLGLRGRGTHDVVPVDDCLVVVPRLAELLAPGVISPGRATELTIRVADGTGERLILAEPTAEGIEAPEDVSVIGADELVAGRRRWFFADVAGHRLRVSASSFFQTRGSGAEALVAVVREQIVGAPDGTFVDLYGGIGLFAVTVAGRASGRGCRAFALGRSRRPPQPEGALGASGRQAGGPVAPDPRRGGGGRPRPGGAHRVRDPTGRGDRGRPRRPGQL